MLPQPASPTFKTALLEVYVRSAPYGGADKSSNGHRYDSVPFVNGMIGAGMSCQPIHYLHEEHDKFFEVCSKFDALVVRCNPGQIGQDGGSQAKFDDAVRALQKKGIQAWPSPDVMEFMGAKDALTKIAHLNIGLEDTLTYYDEAAFIERVARGREAVRGPERRLGLWLVLGPAHGIGVVGVVTYARFR